MNAQKLFGKRLKELRKKNNLTQEKLSEMLGVFQKQIGNIETGTTFTTMPNLVKLAEIFDVEVQDLFSYNHLRPREEIVADIDEMLSQASDIDLQTIYKVVRNIVK